MELGDIKVRTRVVALGSIQRAASRVAIPRTPLDPPRQHVDFGLRVGAPPERGGGSSSRTCSARWRGLTALALAFTLGCERPATEVVVRVDSEITWGLGQRVQSVVLEVRRAGPDGPLRSRQVTPVGTGAGRRPLPLFVGVSESVGDPTTPLWIEALGCAQDSGCARNGAVSAQRAVVRFVPEQTVELTLLLSPACGAARCSLDQWCTPSGNCLPASTAQSTLRPIAGVPTDAASAAATSDATAVDAAMDAPAPPDSPLPPDGAPVGDAAPIDRPDAEPTDRPDAAPTDRPDAAPTDRPASDDVPVDAAPSDLPGDVRPTDVGPMDAALLDTGADTPSDMASTETGPRDAGPADTGPMDAGPMDAGPMDAGPMDAGPVDSGPVDSGPTDTAPRDTDPVDAGVALRCPPGMLTVPAGQFLMGSTITTYEQPVHGVRLSAFCIDETEVTVAAYRACVSAGICPFPVSGTGCNYAMIGRDNHPINCVNWNHAQTYCIWRGGSLPTEAQWEYVARGRESRVYPWGTEAPTSTLVCATPEGPAATSTCPVGTHRTGDSAFGAADMAGNVWEWMLDDYASYTGSSTSFASDPVGTMVGNRAIRGGAYNGTGPNEFRGAYRSLYGPNDYRNVVGFRCEHSPL